MINVKCANCGEAGKTTFHNFKFRLKKRNHQAWLCKKCKNFGMFTIIDIDRILKHLKNLKQNKDDR